MNTIRILFGALLVSSVLFFSCAANSTVKIKSVADLHFVTMRGPVTQSITQYRPLLKLLKNATEKDVIVLEITTHGGYVSTGEVIINALNNTKAHTVASITDYAYSMGALISCNTDRLVMKPGSMIMFHQGSVDYGRLPLADVLYFTEIFIAEMKDKHDVCLNKGIISQEDMDNVMKGKDVFIKAAIINNRLDTKRKK